MKLTAELRKVPEGDVGFVEALAGAHCQGATLDEARANRVEAAVAALQANRTLVVESWPGEEVKPQRSQARRRR